MSVKRFLAGYNDIRMLRIFLIGAISGFPWVLIGSALTLWLKEDGLSRSTVGFAGLIFGVYAFNFLWAPLIDKIKVPVLADRVGPRKAWIFTFQVVIMLCLAGWTMLDPSAQLVMVVGLGLIIAMPRHRRISPLMLSGSNRLAQASVKSWQQVRPWLSSDGGAASSLAVL